MKLVLVADTHCYEPDLPSGDVLVHAGDFLSSGHPSEAHLAAKWLGRQSRKFEHVVCIAGNHDWAFERMGQRGTQDLFNQYASNVTYLLDSSINIGGKNFYGSPWQPEFNNWAFNAARGPDIKKYWDMIPDSGQVDVLITHGPPYGICDQSLPGRSEHFGCSDLARQIEISQPLVHVFGHIHGGYGTHEKSGTTYFNASQVNEAYRNIRTPWEVEI